MKQFLRFGLLADLHYAVSKPMINRYYEQSVDKVKEAVKIFNQQDLDFVIELGDLKDQGEGAERNQTLAFLNTIEGELRKFSGPVYHVLGNHDMDSISKKDFLLHTENPGAAKDRAYYSFTAKGFKCIVLDANFNEDGSDYDRGNFDWTVGIIPRSQAQWLEQELAGPYPAFVFVHQMLDFFSGIDKDFCVKNAPEIVEILEKSGRVLAVFQGHHHQGHYSFRRGIHYYTLKGMIEGPFPENNSFSVVEIDAALRIVLRGFGLCENRIMERR
jgi:alkaline phosphatase